MTTNTNTTTTAHDMRPPAVPSLNARGLLPGQADDPTLDDLGEIVDDLAPGPQARPARPGPVPPDAARHRPRERSMTAAVVDVRRWSVRWWPPVPGRWLRWLLAPVWWSLLFGLAYLAALVWLTRRAWRRARPRVERFVDERHEHQSAR